MLNLEGSASRWLAVVLLAVACFIGILAVAPIPMLMGFLSDDAFYYLQIARSIAQGEGSTFDGIAVTNGYHPLWMLIVVIVMKLLGGSPVAAAAVVLAITAVICGAAILLAVRIVERRVAPGCGAIAAAVMLSPFAFSAMTNGMETSMAMFAVLVLFWYCYKTDALSADAGVGVSAGLGAILAFVFLSRLDLAFVPVAAGILVAAGAWSARAGFRKFVLKGVAMLAPFLVITFPYLLLNHQQFGSISPISGTVKSSFPHVRDSLHLEGDSTIGLAMLVALTVLTLIATLRAGTAHSAARWRSPLVLATIASWLHFVYVYLFMDWGVYWWHFTLSAVALAIALPAAMAALRLGGPRLVIPLALVIALAGMALQYQVGMNRYTRHMAWLEAAEWARQTTPPDTVFAIKDAGLFRYFSERPVVNLDGKANGKEFWQHVVDGRIWTYLRNVGVSHIGEINAYCMDGGCNIRIHVPNAQDVFLRMHDTDIVYTGRPSPGRIGSAGADVRFRVWRVPAP